MFADRRDAGNQLGAVVKATLSEAAEATEAILTEATAPGEMPDLAEAPHAASAGTRSQVRPVVLGLPRGGVVVAAEVAVALHCPIDVLVVRKLGHPAHPELGFGALAEGGVRVLNGSLIRRLGIPERVIEAVTAAEEAEARRRVARYRAGRPPLDLTRREVMIVDDGLATGYTMLAAVASARQRGAARILVAVPVGAADSVRALHAVSDDVICLFGPPGLRAVGEAYERFGDTGDDEVVAALSRARDLVRN